MPDKQFDLLTNERQWFVALSKEFGMPVTLLARLMSSRDYTLYLANSIVEAARADIQIEQMRRRD